MASIDKTEDLQSFDVPEVTRHPGGYTIYKIVLQITPKEFTQNSYQLIYWKRYSEIRKLYETLNRYHQAIYRPGKLPDFPTKAGYWERFNSAVIEERRLATKEFLNFAIQHVYLRTHDAYINFFQNGEKVILPDVEADTLQPESVSSISTPAKEEITEDLIVSDEENHTLDKLLEDLNNLNVPPTDLEDNDANTSSQ